MVPSVPPTRSSTIGGHRVADALELALAGDEPVLGHDGGVRCCAGAGGRPAPYTASCSLLAALRRGSSSVRSRVASALPGLVVDDVQRPVGADVDPVGLAPEARPARPSGSSEGHGTEVGCRGKPKASSAATGSGAVVSAGGRRRRRGTGRDRPGCGAGPAARRWVGRSGRALVLVADLLADGGQPVPVGRRPWLGRGRAGRSAGGPSTSTMKRSRASWTSEPRSSGVICSWSSGFSTVSTPRRSLTR